MSEKKSLKQRIADLDEAVEWFYSEDFDLEKAVEHYKTAFKLGQEVEGDLAKLKNQIEVLPEDFTKA